MYESFYGLAAKPFQLSPDPRFFFNSKGHKRALAYLRYGIKQGEGFIIITGDVGTGKTTLVSTLFQSLDRENIIGAQIVTTQMQADDLLRMVAASFDLPYQRIGKAALLVNLESFFRSCVKDGKRVLLVVDEAQGLPRKAIEELRMLSNFSYGGRALLQSFLLGQREFRTTMRSEGFEQLRQRVIAAYHLRPLDQQETTAYIQHRLRTAGWKGDPSFTAEAFQGIFEFTQGVPRRVNTLCDRLLLFGFLEEIHCIDAAALRSVAQDIIEEQGGNTAPQTLPRAAPARAPLPPAEPSPVTAAPASEAVDEARLAAVESSVASLTESLRQELAMLREALMANARAEKKKEE